MLKNCIKNLLDLKELNVKSVKNFKNSLEVSYSNGPIEGINNKIKALKRTTFGMTKFENFKARIMLLN